MYGKFLADLPDAQAVDMAFTLAYIYFDRTGTFADIVVENKQKKVIYKPSDEIRKSLQISIENWHSSCNINK